jgi:D-tyrosyl-tRNA(Tyr) deacylase
MRALIQRVRRASVRVDSRTIASIDNGLCVFLGIHHQDTAEDSDYIIRKLLSLRLFPSPEGEMAMSLSESGYQLLLVSQFTLYGDARKGTRPSWSDAMPPEEARNMYDDFSRRLREQYPHVEEGIFGAAMEVELSNQGPVTLLVESKKS